MISLKKGAAALAADLCRLFSNVLPGNTLVLPGKPGTDGLRGARFLGFFWSFASPLPPFSPPFGFVGVPKSVKNACCTCSGPIFSIFNGFWLPFGLHVLQFFRSFASFFRASILYGFFIVFWKAFPSFFQKLLL